MTEDELKQRFRTFSIRILRLCAALPKTDGGWAISRQLVRSGTAPGAHYRAGCRARSGADFINKLAIAEEEMDESEYWLDLIIAEKMLPPQRVVPLRKEANELLKILIASRITTSQSLTAKERRRPNLPPVNRKSKIENRKSP